MPGNRRRRGNYRFDVRSKDEFKKDIADCHRIEQKILDLWLDRLEAALGKRPAYRATGCGPDGRYLKQNEVSMSADFEVDEFGPIEVKFAKPLLTAHFHLKVDQVKAYLDQDANILMVNGWETESPKFVLISTADLRQMVDTLPIVSWVGFGNKASYRIPVDKFVWRSLR